VRWIVLALFAVLVGATAGCPVASLDAQAGDDHGGGSGSAKGLCFEDVDCVLAATKCCECPTFAVPRNDPAHAACDGVMCPDPQQTSCPNNVVAVCLVDHCELSCAKVACSNTCEFGYRKDANGCLSCDCATPATECSLDTQCIETRADCCGCKRGGADTAVLASAQASYDGKLMCSATPSCPNVDTCKANQVPKCIQGACALVAAQLPPNACGRTGLATCAATETCLVNADDEATRQGVGICSPP
jgi:antistasin family protein